MNPGVNLELLNGENLHIRDQYLDLHNVISLLKS